MRNIFIIISLFISLSAKTQFINVTTSGSPTTLLNSKGGYLADSALSVLSKHTFTDTTSANLSVISKYKGTIIYTSGDDSYWIRRLNPNRWDKFNTSAASLVSISQLYGITLTPNPITSTGTVGVDTSVIVSKPYFTNIAVKYWDTATMLNPYLRKSDTSNLVAPYLRKSDTLTMLLPYLRKSDTLTMLSKYLRKTDTANMVLPYLRKSDTATMLAPYARTSSLGNYVVGPASATDNAFPIYDGTTGKLIKNSPTLTVESGTPDNIFSIRGKAMPAEAGYSMEIIAGNGVSGGYALLQAGHPSNDNGQTAYVQGSDGVGTNKNGGNVSLLVGQKTGSGINGKIQLVRNGGAFSSLNLNLDRIGNSGSTKEIYFPDSSGTIALTSNLTNLTPFQGTTNITSVAANANLSLTGNLTVTGGTNIGALTSTVGLAVIKGADVNLTTQGLDLINNTNNTIVGKSPALSMLAQKSGVYAGNRIYSRISGSGPSIIEGQYTADGTAWNAQFRLGLGTMLFYNSSNGSVLLDASGSGASDYTLTAPNKTGTIAVVSDITDSTYWLKSGTTVTGKLGVSNLSMTGNGGFASLSVTAGGTIGGALTSSGSVAFPSLPVAKKSKMLFIDDVTGAVFKGDTTGTGGGVQYWQRVATTLSPSTSGDNISTTGTITGTGLFSNASVTSNDYKTFLNGSGTVTTGARYGWFNTSGSDGMLLQLNAANGIDIWNLISSSYSSTPVANIARSGNISTTGSLASSGLTVTGGVEAGTVIVTNSAQANALTSTKSLTVGGISTFTGMIAVSSFGTYASYLQSTRATSNSVTPGSANGSLVFGGGTSQVRIGTANDYNIDLDNSASPLVGLKINQNGNIFNAANSIAFNTTSDPRIKSNIRDLNMAVDKIMALHPVMYDYTDKFIKYKNLSANLSKNQSGFLATEYQKVFPAFVETSNVSELGISDLKSINTAPILPTVVAAMQEQQKEISSLKAENKSQQTQINELKAAIKALQKK